MIENITANLDELALVPLALYAVHKFYWTVKYYQAGKDRVQSDIASKKLYGWLSNVLLLSSVVLLYLLKYL